MRLFSKEKKADEKTGQRGHPGLPVRSLYLKNPSRFVAVKFAGDFNGSKSFGRKMFRKSNKLLDSKKTIRYYTVTTRTENYRRG